MFDRKTTLLIVTLAFGLAACATAAANSVLLAVHQLIEHTHRLSPQQPGV